MNGAITSTTADREEILTASDGVKEVNNIYIYIVQSKPGVGNGIGFPSCKTFSRILCLDFLPKLENKLSLGGG